MTQTNTIQDNFNKFINLKRLLNKTNTPEQRLKIKARIVQLQIYSDMVEPKSPDEKYMIDFMSKAELNE